ncbi:hypothetical protein BDR05DRAFT_333204 [Suillus weaverae]|nr:hypothetical protein BDR05DRAFT_333204 [Suillus weaverae]
MQMFIPSVLSALEALLKGPVWLLRKVISIFYGRRESSPPPIPSSALCSLSDSPYESAHSQNQRSYERTHSQQQRSTYHAYPPPHPASAHQPPSQHKPYQPHRQPSVRFPAQPTPPVSPDVIPVATEPVRSHIPQRSRRFSGPELATSNDQPHRQPSVRFPAQPTPPVSPDVTPVATEPVRSHIPQVCLSMIYLAVLSIHLFDTAITSFFFACKSTR